MEQLKLNPNQLMQKYERHYPESFFCSLSLEKMTNPILHQCGKSYEEAIIRDWIGRKSTCPNCRAEARIEDFKPNLDLKTAIEEFPEKILRVIEKADNKIVSLENDKVVLQNDKVVLRNERDQANINVNTERQEKEQVLEQLQDMMVRVQLAENRTLPTVVRNGVCWVVDTVTGTPMYIYDAMRF